MRSLKIAVVFILLVNGVFSLIGWLSSDPEPGSLGQYSQPAITQAPPPPQAAEGFDLKALTVLTKEVRSGQELERRLNEKGSINNLDLDDNGKVDYLQVEEFGQPESGKIGYSVFSEPAKNQRQEIAEVTVEQNKDTAEIQVIGNPEIYGEGEVYNDFTPVKRENQPAQTSGAAYPMQSSYFMPHPLWMSPFGFGYYPPYYGFFPLMAHSMYMSRFGGGYGSTVRSGPSSHQQTSNKQISNPNKGKSASSGIKRSLRKPTATQKQFQSKATNQRVGKGGFGQNRSVTARKSTGTSSQKKSSSFGQRRGNGFGSGSSVRQGRSGGGFGSNAYRSSGSVRGFGSNAYRSSGSVRGFGGSSRSFSFGGK